MDILDELSKHLPEDMTDIVENLSEEDKEEMREDIEEEIRTGYSHVEDERYPHVIEPYVGDMMTQLVAQSGPVRKKAPAKNKKAKNKMAKASRKKNRKNK